MKHILDVSCEVEARGSHLGCEQALLVLQAVTHIALEGTLQGLISGGKVERQLLRTNNRKVNKLGVKGETPINADILFLHLV